LLQAIFLWLWNGYYTILQWSREYENSYLYQLYLLLDDSLPFAYLTAISLDLGPIGVFWVITLAEILIAIISLIWFKKGKWKTVKV